MKEYVRLKEFWNSCFSGLSGEKIEGRFISDANFNNAMNLYLKDGYKLLDYGCGTGWASFELAQMKNLSEIIGIDPSINAVNYANECAEKSSFNNMKFISSDESELNNYIDYFDMAISVNTLDVVPDEIIESILLNVSKSLKKDGVFIVCLNPLFDEKFMLETIKLEKRENCFFKDDVLRCNYKNVEEWKKVFSKYFDFQEYLTFAISENETIYPRQMYILVRK